MFLAAGAAALLSGCSMTAPYRPSGATNPAALDVGTMVARINETRRQYGAGPLAYNPALDRIARAHARLMASRQTMSHDLGGNLRERSLAGGYEGATGENLATGQRTLEQTIESWLKSPGHRQILLNRRFVEFGLAAETSSQGRAYWAFVAGGPHALWG